MSCHDALGHDADEPEDTAEDDQTVPAVTMNHMPPALIPWSNDEYDADVRRIPFPSDERVHAIGDGNVT